MMAIGMVLIYLAIRHKMEPTLLLPMGFGAILANIPGSMVVGEKGILTWLYEFGIEGYEVFPLLLFIGIGAMIDFGPLLQKPWLIFVGAAGQGGVFITLMVASLLFPSHYRSCRWSYCNSCFRKTTLPVHGFHTYCSIFIYGFGTNNPAPCIEEYDDKKREGNTDDVHCHFRNKSHKDNIPCCRNHHFLLGGS